MQKQRSSEKPVSVLRPTIPVDIGERSQRQRILDAMIDSCAEKTYAATTITDIVARAHISRTTFYKHYEDKRACSTPRSDTASNSSRRWRPRPTRPRRHRRTRPARRRPRFSRRWRRARDWRSC